MDRVPGRSFQPLWPMTAEELEEGHWWSHGLFLFSAHKRQRRHTSTLLRNPSRYVERESFFCHGYFPVSLSPYPFCPRSLCFDIRSIMDESKQSSIITHRSQPLLYPSPNKLTHAMLLVSLPLLWLHPEMLCCFFWFHRGL